MNELEGRLLKMVEDTLNLEEIEIGIYRSQWGDVNTYFRGRHMWIELLGNKVSILIDEHSRKLEEIEDTLASLIPYNIKTAQMKMF